MTATQPATKDLLDRAMSAWRPFRAAAMALGADALEGVTSAGWTYKEMLAHVSAWHELTARRLQVYRETGRAEPPTGPDAACVFEELGFRPADREALLRDWHFDRFNAAVAAVAKDRRPEDVLRELDETFARVTAALATVTDEQAAHVEGGKSFVYAVVEGNTFGHYAEHAAELGIGNISAVP